MLQQFARYVLKPRRGAFMLAGAIATFAAVQAVNANQAVPAPAAQTPPALQTPADQTEIDAAILDRQLIMQDLEKDSDTLGKIVSYEVKADKLKEVTAALAKSAKDSYESFKINAPGGGARPEVWSNWADFSARMEKFVANTEKMDKAAQNGATVATVTEMLIDALPCKECHDSYRIKKAAKPAG